MITMISTVSQNIGKVTATLTVTNWVDEILAERGFIQSNPIRFNPRECSGRDRC